MDLRFAKPIRLLFEFHLRRHATAQRRYGNLSDSSGILFEVTPDKQVVWQYMNPPHTQPAEGQGGGAGRGGRGGPGGGPIQVAVPAYRYGPDYPGLAGKELTPEKTLEEYAAPPSDK